MSYVFKVESVRMKHADPNNPGKYLIGEYKNGQITVHPFSKKFQWMLDEAGSWDNIMDDDYHLPYLIYAENQLLTQ